jgi:glycosyltransferase involved in cell wall biosynthesis
MHTLSVILLTYNQEKFVKEALLSLLNQNCENLEIVISDDFSNDSTYKVLNDTLDEYQGDKKVKLVKNEKNLGIIGNFNAALDYVSGDLIFIAGGDDISVFNRCRVSYDFWINSGAKYDLVASDGYDMTQDGTILEVKKTDSLENWTLDKWHLNSRPYFFGASFMITRNLTSLNVLDIALPYEDQVYVHRALMMGGAVRLPEPLVYHRRGGVSQPEKHQVFGVKKERLLQAANANLVELNQFISDAKKLKLFTLITNKVKDKHDLEVYTKRILKSKVFSEKVKLFLYSKNIKLAKRIRFFKYSLFG